MIRIKVRKDQAREFSHVKVIKEKAQVGGSSPCINDERFPLTEENNVASSLTDVSEIDFHRAYPFLGGPQSQSVSGKEPESGRDSQSLLDSSRLRLARRLRRFTYSTFRILCVTECRWTTASNG